jgi:hypothetical protein
MLQTGCSPIVLLAHLDFILHMPLQATTDDACSPMAIN